MDSHLQILATDGSFYNNGAFMVNPSPKADDVAKLFRYEVFKILRCKSKISDAVIENMMSWRHNGFNVFCGPTIWERDEKGMVNPARYIIRASFSQALRLLQHRAREDRKKKGNNDEVPALIEPEVSSKELGQSWVQLILKVYAVDPLVCPKCHGVMKFINFIENL